MKNQVHLIRGHDPKLAHLFAAVRKREEEFHSTSEYQELMKELGGQLDSVKLRAERELGYKMGYYKTPPRF